MGPYHSPAGCPVTPPISHNTPGPKAVAQARRVGNTRAWGDAPTTALARPSFQLEEPRSQCSAASPPRIPQTARQVHMCCRGRPRTGRGQALRTLGHPDVCGRRPRPVSTRHESHVSCPAEGGVRSIFSCTHRGASLTRTPIPGTLARVWPAVWQATACRAAVRHAWSQGLTGLL